MKNSFCNLSENEIRELPERFLGFLLSPFQFNRHNGFVQVPEESFKEMIDLLTQAAQDASRVVDANPDTAPSASRDASQEPQSAAPAWVAAEDMPSMPIGWYWAEFPGGWEFFKPQRNATLGIDHARSGWQPLMAKRYWGPFQPAGTALRIEV